MKRSQRDANAPVLITAAAVSYQEQHALRRKKYAIMMSLRLPLLLAAVLSYQIWWLALLFIVISIPLPWMAVLIANDRPARKAESVSRYRAADAKALESRDHPTIDG